MFEEAISMWASLNGWFTPTVLFLLLNLMIGTIAVTSGFTKSHKSHSPEIQTQPSVLQRLRSLNFYSYNITQTTTIIQQQQQQQQSPEIQTQPSVLQRLRSLDLYSYIHTNQPQKQQPPLPPLSDPVPQEADDDDESPTMEEIYSRITQRSSQNSDTEPNKSTQKPTEVEVKVEVEVDARADDFINRFRAQLKMQRLESLNLHHSTR